MLSVGMLLRSKPENVRRLARSLGLLVLDRDPHGLLCQRVMAALWRRP